MTETHKAALAEGRAESRVIKNYLEALDENRPKRGRRRTKDGIDKRLAQIETEWDSASPLKRVSLIQERMDLNAERDAPTQTVDLSELEAGFIANAKAYSERKGLSYAAWRELGVSSAVLKAANISR